MKQDLGEGCYATTDASSDFIYRGIGCYHTLKENIKS